MSCLHSWQGVGADLRCAHCNRRPHASPSQIETWGRVVLEKDALGQLHPTRVGCRRKWKYQRLGRKRQESEAAKFGTRTHAILENYQTHGTWTPTIAASPEGKCLAAGLDRFPPPGQGVAEQSVYEEIGGVLWCMKVDSMSEWRAGYSVRVQDLKTTGDLKWAKTPEQLADDPQRIAYAAWAGQRLGVSQVECEWVYCRRKPPKSVTVTYVESAADTRRRLEQLVEETVRPMIAANSLPLDAFPRDGLVTGACEAFGGCEHKAECLGGIKSVDLLAIRMQR